MLKIKAKIIEAGWTMTALAEEINKRNNTNYSVQNLSKKIRKGTLRYSEAEQIADILGYKIQWTKPIEVIQILDKDQ